MICLPMAGLSRRFFEAGYDRPKYMLDLQGQTVFAHALRSFENFFDRETFVIVCRADYDTPEFVRSECAAAGLPADNLALVVLDHETDGQAETVATGLSKADADPEASLTVFNIDTFRPGFRHPPEIDISEVFGYLEVFEGEGDHWSFAEPDPDDSPAVLRVAEKERISNLCSTGLYHFRTVAEYLALYNEIAGRDPATLQGGERYIAPLYNSAIARGERVCYALISADDVQFCGTPAEYEHLKSRAL